MAFHFKKKESVAKGSRRLGRERIEHALERLEKGDHAEAVHCARKDIKKARRRAFGACQPQEAIVPAHD